MDFIVELPEEHSIYNIDWLGVWCEKFAMNFGHVNLVNVSDRIPPYVSPVMKVRKTLNCGKLCILNFVYVLQLSQQDQPISDNNENWPVLYMFGNKSRNSFTFQLGAPGGRRAYAAWWMKSQPAQYVWYVNGQMAPDLWLETDVTYNFV